MLYCFYKVILKNTCESKTSQPFLNTLIWAHRIDQSERAWQFSYFIKGRLSRLWKIIRKRITKLTRNVWFKARLVLLKYFINPTLWFFSPRRVAFAMYKSQAPFIWSRVPETTLSFLCKIHPESPSRGWDNSGGQLSLRGSKGNPGIGTTFLEINP